MNRPGKKQKIINAAKQLLLEVGYESMSPAMVLQRSGAGQGSLYHHFSGKKELACVALREVADELSGSVQTLFEDETLGPFEKIDRFLARKRDGLQGCKMGRLSNEKAFRDDELRTPMQQYFALVRLKVAETVKLGVAQGEFPPETPVEAIADLVVSAVQGGYVVSKAFNDGAVISSATDGARTLLAAYRRKAG
jgi:AcrR family transcriptional regulator